MKIINFLRGKKSYLVAVLTAIYACLKAFKVIETTPEQDITIYTLLAALFGVTISAKINRSDS